MSMNNLPDRVRSRLHGAKRQSTQISIKMYVDVIDDLKLISDHKGFSGYQPLMKYYIHQGMRKDLEEVLDKVFQDRLVSALRDAGVNEATLQDALNKAQAS
jgi:predicted metal-dependent phosphotriesterase family hydrolase